ncbi:MAG TPA: diguanylate cyclase, partial [Spirochaetota bacterium]|nr:diguanylate cyclase [Spirochaetota bacterium]
GRMVTTGTRTAALQEIKNIVSPLVENYIIYNDRGDVLDHTGADITVSSAKILNGIKALARKELAGEKYQITVDEGTGNLNFFIPVIVPAVQNPVLYFSMSTGEINRSLRDLYKLAFFIISIIALLHIFFAFLFYKIIVYPIRLLKRQSGDISNGDLNARVNLHRTDEIGALSSSLNRMAENIHEKISIIENMAVTDALTGLCNRRNLFERINSELSKAKRNHSGLGALMIDIDHFKKINDTYGHMAGDSVISGIADLLKKSCRASDVIARYGGEEFAVITESGSLKEIKALAERIRKAAEKLVFSEDDTLSVTISIGISFFAPELLEHVKDIEKILYYPDQGLYRAKRNGRNRTEQVRVTKKALTGKG